MKKIVLWVIATTLLSIQAHAYEIKNVCVKYQTSQGWSQIYKVQASIYNGNELNQATGSLLKYSLFDYYALIWWNQGQVSIIQLQGYFPGMLFQIPGVDEQGRRWQVSENSIFGSCY